MKQLVVFFILLTSHFLTAQECCNKNAHAHNDYKHKHPLSDALQNKFNSIEADVFLINKQLIVSHIHPVFRNKSTLETLYLKPLLDSCSKHNGYVYENCKESIILLIDIKSDADETYLELKKIVEKYQSILTKYENGKVITKAVTIILSGNKPYSTLQNDSVRYAFIDQSLLSLNKPYNQTVCAMASTKYSNVFKWKGKGKIPKDEKENLISLVNKAHQQGKKVRLWASPENKNVWTELLNCGVDLINTDKLEDLRKFLTENKK